MRSRLRVPMIGLVTLVSLLGAGCSRGGGSAGPAGLEKTNLTVAAVPALDSAGVYIAQERGLFTAEGLHVKIVSAISSADVIARQLAGKYDVTSGAYPSYIEADAQGGAHFKVLVSGSTMGPATQEVVVLPGSPINTIADLKGKTIGLNAPENIGALLVSSLLNDNAVDPRSVHFRYIPFPAMAHALQTHQVDAAWLPEPFITEVEESIGAQPLADANQGAAESLPIAGYMVTQSWEQKYPNTAAAFRRALVEAQAIAANNLSAVQQSMARFAGVPRMSASIVAAPGFPTQTQAGPLQRVVSLMVQYNLLTQGYNAALMIPRSKH